MANATNSSCTINPWFDTDVGLHLVLVSVTAMGVLLAYSGIQVAINLVRLCSKRKVALFCESKMIFSLFTLVFCLGRSFFFGVTIFQSVVGPNHFLPNTDTIIDFVIQSVYHLASTCFFAGFIFLSVHSAEVYLYVYGMGPATCVHTLRIPRIFVIVIIVVIFLIQGILIVVLLVNMTGKLQPSNTLGEKDYDLQLWFHGVLSILTVLFFFVWLIIAKRNVYTLRMYRQNSAGTFRALFATLVVLSVILLLKSGTNFALAILDHCLCENTKIFIMSFGGMPLDVVPVLFVTLLLNRSSGEGDEYTLKDGELLLGGKGSILLPAPSSPPPAYDEIQTE